MQNENISRLDDHILIKKKGIVATPLNNALRDQLKLNSWAMQRLPEYFWLALILDYHGREAGIKHGLEIQYLISKSVKSLQFPRLSQIFNLPKSDQSAVFNIIINNIEKEILSPLTILYPYSKQPLFNTYFNVPTIHFEQSLSILVKVLKKFYPHQSNDATDLRYLTLGLLVHSGNLVFSDKIKVATEALVQYPHIHHDDERMRSYRPMIRSMESVDLIDQSNYDFSNNFWRNIGMITPCKPIAVNFDEDKTDYKVVTEKYKKCLTYLLNAFKEDSLISDKFDVLINSTNYVVKIFIEITESTISTGILGRHGLRTIIEVYLMLKYLTLTEKEKTNIWSDYKLYSISKFKLVLLKLREKKPDESSHIVPPILDILVNELKSEEFIDVDLKFFDRVGIREKSTAIGEKELYDLSYDYDTNYVHGFWGAVREGATLTCDNVAHQHQCIPDIGSQQKLKDVASDCQKIIDKIFLLLEEHYEIPESYK